MVNTNFDNHKKELLQNPEFRRKYEALEPKYKLIKALIRRRNELRLNQTQVAIMVGTQQPAIARLENGSHNTKIGTLFKVTDALGLDVEVKPRSLIKG